MRDLATEFGKPRRPCAAPGNAGSGSRHRLTPYRNSNHTTAFADPIRPIGGKIDMIKHLPPPTEAEEYRNTAEILRDLAAQVRFGNTRNELVNLAGNLDRLAAEADHVCGALDWSPSLPASEAHSGTTS
jgi:hypothetical protein